jgi:hypothetical protein
MPPAQRLALVILIVICVYWPAGFYPFSPLPERANAARFDSQGILNFPASGIALSSSTPGWMTETIIARKIRIDLEVRSTDEDQLGATIATLTAGSGERNITIGQHKRLLVVQWRTPGTDGPRTQSVYLGKVFAPDAWKRIHIELDDQQLSIDVDGEQALTRSVDVAPFDAWLSDVKVTLGNRIEFNRPWRGQIRRASIGPPGTQTNYTAPDTLEMPPKYTFVASDRTRHLVRFYSFDTTPALLRDWIINTVGFLPLGALIYALFALRLRVVMATLACLLISLSIELTQVFLPWRVPSAQDLLFNTLGGFVGASSAALWLRWHNRRTDRGVKSN